MRKSRNCTFLSLSGVLTALTLEELDEKVAKLHSSFTRS